MKKIILDTDIGIDCDDAVALGLLLTAQKQELCRVLAITASTTRKGATATIKAICRYYRAQDIPIGRLRGIPLGCDKTDTYATAVQKEFGETDEQKDAVALIRETLSRQNEQVVLIAIGPLTNVCNVLKSGADEYSPLTGKELIEQKVKTLYVMGGCFKGSDDGELMTEWNIAQDIPSARYVAEEFPCEMVYCPSEVGKAVKTKMGNNMKNPVWFSMLSHAKYMHGANFSSDFFRESWDPVTCLAAVTENNNFVYSEYGEIKINETGQTLFYQRKNGKHRYLSTESCLTKIEQIVNSNIE